MMNAGITKHLFSNNNISSWPYLILCMVSISNVRRKVVNHFESTKTSFCVVAVKGNLMTKKLAASFKEQLFV